MPSPSFTDIIRAYLEDQFDGGGSGITVDAALSETSENPVQNKVITAALALKAAIADIPEMADDEDMTDWASGKTVDAAILKTLFLAAVDTLDIKANISDIPTAVSELTNDSGYQTASQVQTAIDNSLAQIPYAESEVF